jgi:DNA-binding SARP family transcriptional activator
VVRFRLLGPVRVLIAGREVRLPPRERTVLAVLLLRAGRVVSASALAEAVWGDTPPPGARNTIQGQVKRLRQLLGPASERIVTRAPGYLISVQPGELDEHEFADLRARAEGAAAALDWELAASLLREALALWAGEPLADVPSQLLQGTDAPRLAELRLGALEGRIDADLRLGQSEVVAELRGLVTQFSFRERLWELLMLALYRAGRQGEALSAYQQARELLRAELGIEPGYQLQQLHHQILRADPALATSLAGARRAARIPRQLPGSLPDFTGRVAEVGRLREALVVAGGRPGSGPVAVITGAAGIGKTALALHTAHLAADQFPDGQLHANLAGTSRRPASPADVLARFLRDLGMPAGDVPADTCEREASYRSILADRRILLVLDDARDAAQVRSLMPGSADSAVVITSRRRLPDLIASCRCDLAELGPD